MGPNYWALVVGLLSLAGVGPKHRVLVPYPVYVGRTSVSPLRQIRIGENYQWVKVCPSGQKALIYRSDDRLQLWNNQEEELEETWHPRSELTCAALSPRGDLLAMADDLGTIRVLDCESGERQQSLAGRGAVCALAFAPYGQYLASADHDGAKLWDLTTGRVSHTFHKVKDVSGLAFSTDGALLALGTRDGQIHLWQTQRRRFVKELRIGEPVLSVAFASTGNLTVGTASGWSTWTPSGQCLSRVLTDSPVTSIALDRKTSQVVTAGRGRIEWWPYLQEE